MPVRCLSRRVPEYIKTERLRHFTGVMDSYTNAAKAMTLYIFSNPMFDP